MDPTDSADECAFPIVRIIADNKAMKSMNDFFVDIIRVIAAMLTCGRGKRLAHGEIGDSVDLREQVPIERKFKGDIGDEGFGKEDRSFAEGRHKTNKRWPRGTLDRAGVGG
jgi:hypothetical protein